MPSIGISDVVTASVYSEETRLKKLMMMMKMIIIIIALPYRRVTICRPDNKHSRCRTGEDSECEVEKKLLSRRCLKGIGKFLAL